MVIPYDERPGGFHFPLRVGMGIKQICSSTGAMVEKKSVYGGS